MDTEIQLKDPKEQLETEMQELVQQSVVTAEPLVKGSVVSAVEALGLPPKDTELELSIQRAKLEQEVQALVKESQQNVSDDAEEQMTMPPGYYGTGYAELAKARQEQWSRTPLSFQRLQSEQARWSQYNFGHLKSDYNAPFKGMVEELGELSHSLLKQEQGIRGTFEEHEKNAKDAIGDMLVFMADFCTRKGWDMQEIIDVTWAEVKKRDWVKFPKNGLTE